MVKLCSFICLEFSEGVVPGRKPRGGLLHLLTPGIPQVRQHVFELLLLLWLDLRQGIAKMLMGQRRSWLASIRNQKPSLSPTKRQRRKSVSGAGGSLCHESGAPVAAAQP